MDKEMNYQEMEDGTTARKETSAESVQGEGGTEIPQGGADVEAVQEENGIEMSQGEAGMETSQEEINAHLPCR